MINNLWKCFETTGDIHTYLGFKDYERLRSEHIGVHFLNESFQEDVVIDKASE